jgi:hypothetical protein
MSNRGITLTVKSANAADAIEVNQANSRPWNRAAGDVVRRPRRPRPAGGTATSH